MIGGMRLRRCCQVEGGVSKPENIRYVTHIEEMITLMYPTPGS